jgi:hypothetical protein
MGNCCGFGCEAEDMYEKKQAKMCKRENLKEWSKDKGGISL